MLGILPDKVHEVDGKMVASFRPETQAIRVMAKDAGLPVEMVAPEGAEFALYTQYAVDWVLPTLVGAGTGVPCQILATLLAARIKGLWQRSEEPPTVVFRELVEEDGKLTETEIRGPAADIEALLRARAESSDHSRSKP